MKKINIESLQNEDNIFMGSPVDDLDIGVVGNGVVGRAFARSLLNKSNGKNVNFYDRRSLDEIKYYEHDVLFYAGVPGTKHLANSSPDYDRGLIEKSRRTIENSRAEKIILVSTIDAQARSGSDYHSTYGDHRRELEEKLIERVGPGRIEIIRLPMLFDPMIVKNIIFDCANNIAMKKPIHHLEMKRDYYDLIMKIVRRFDPDSAYSYDKRESWLVTEPGSRVSSGSLGMMNLVHPDSRFVAFDLRDMYDFCSKLEFGDQCIHTLSSSLDLDGVSKHALSVSDIYQIAGTKVDNDVLEMQRKMFNRYDHVDFFNESPDPVCIHKELSWESIFSELVEHIRNRSPKIGIFS